MSKSTFVTVYRLEVEATLPNLTKMEDFVEAISDVCIVSSDQGCVAIITCCDDAMSIAQMSNTAIQFFGHDNYSLTSIGILGPFKKSH